MASGIFALLDDIAALMDDVVVMTKVTAKKTAGILGDDLAVNAEKATGFVASRELPVLWAITKGSFLNKLIILPVAFLLSSFLPWAITLILVLGGVYLAFEGAEKIIEYIWGHEDSAGHADVKNKAAGEILDAEKTKIKSAIFTDFILSIEIIIIALGSVLDQPISFQIVVVSLVAAIATVGVYGIVALIVRMDDVGLYLIKKSSKPKSFLGFMGKMLVKGLPVIIKSLSVIGTIALVLVSGGIFSHNVEYFHHIMLGFPSVVKDFILGLGIGFIAVLLVWGFKKLFKK